MNTLKEVAQPQGAFERFIFSKKAKVIAWSMSWIAIALLTTILVIGGESMNITYIYDELDEQEVFTIKENTDE